MTICRNFVAELRGSDSVHAALELLHRAALRLGFDVIGVVPRIDALGRPLPEDSREAAFVQSWVAHDGGLQTIVIDDMHAHCPVTNFSRREHRPFAWRTDDPRMFARRGPLAQRQAAIMRFLRRFRVAGGITTPVHRPFGDAGLISWMTTDPALDLRSHLEDKGQELFFLAHHFLAELAERHVAAMAKRHADSARLSEREIECLRWAALGKTEREIGDIIARSESTARFHLKNAMRKLHANNRTHAVAKACHYGLLGEIL
ncbi:MAG TPA: autoinducer binding domain-containing protein [Sphingomonadales bacterium]